MNIIYNNVENPKAHLILAHGAGAGCHSEFMVSMSQLLAAHNIGVYRFNFQYMQRIEDEGKRRPPSKAPVLIKEFTDILTNICENVKTPVWIGGKSMGGRMASMMADNQSVAGVVCLGYPFHPPGRPEKLRIDHLQSTSKPMLIVQGERDTFGSQNEVSDYTLDPDIELIFMEDGDHSLKPRKSSGLNHSSHIASAADAIADFVTRVHQ